MKYIKHHHLAILILAILILLATGYFFRKKIINFSFAPTEQENIVLDPNLNPAENLPSLASSPEIVAQNLTVPWEIEILPNDDLLVTERSGTLKKLGQNPFDIKVPNVNTTGEGGLLGLALHPDFESNNWIYLYLTTRDSESNELFNQLVRYKFSNNQISDPKTIIDNIPGRNFHDGGRMIFGLDRLLYVATGDAQDTSLAQDKNSLAGKILRVTDSGETPKDNPFGNLIYSYGHRNIQGLAFDKSGNLWSTEHGRSGLRSGLDELNKITKGGNYGWPIIEGDQTAPGMIAPTLHSGPDITWAPADMVIIKDSLFFAGLRGQSIYQTSTVNPNKVIANYFETYGRIRSITYKDNYLYFGTSNQDGRGKANPGDDKIYRVLIK